MWWVLLTLAGWGEATHQQQCTGAGTVGRYWYNGCNQKCVCELVSTEYVWVCYRERKEFSCMSSAERSLYMNTYKAISTSGHPMYPQWVNLIARHATNFGTIHTSQWFLPWHRWFSYEMENLLQNVNCKVTLPWWDTAKNAGAPWGVSPWGAAADLLGTSGGCVTNGGFANPAWPGGPHGCLSRTNSGTLPTAADQNVVMNIVPTQYVNFTDSLEGDIHNLVHVRVGGTMLQGWSPEAPEFFLHHNNIDRLWDEWQRKSNAHMTSYSGAFNLNLAMPVAMGATPADHNSLAATKVMYVRKSATSLGAGHPSLAFCFLVLGVDWAVLSAAMARAPPSTIIKIPQLAAVPLTDAEERMMIEMVQKSRGGAQNVPAFQRKLNLAQERAKKRNEALENAGTLRKSFEKREDKALGFDVAKAIELLNIPKAQGSQGTADPSSPITVKRPTPQVRTPGILTATRPTPVRTTGLLSGFAGQLPFGRGG